MTISLENAPTEFICASGINFAYRRLGAGNGTPLILLQHFTGHMDSWDPAVVNGGLPPGGRLRQHGPRYASGKTPDNVAQMAVDAGYFLAALGFDKVDLLGYSLGGFVAQLLTVNNAGVVRKLILAGTAPQGGEEHLLKVLKEAYSHKEAPDVRLPLFFTPSEASQAAGLAFIKRSRARTVNRDPESGDTVSKPQAKALIDYASPSPNRYRRRPQLLFQMFTLNARNVMVFP